jgi:hypothetical protein
VIPNLKLYIYAAAVAAVFGAGWYVHGIFTGHKILDLEAAYANERTLSAEQHAADEAKQRQVETDWRARVDLANAASTEAVALREARIGALNATTGKLQQRIASLSKPGSTPTDPGTAASNLQLRVTVLGSLLVDLDGMAEASAREADSLREELALCRDYVRAISDHHSGQ